MTLEVARKVAAFEPPYHVNLEGKRVTVETCTCYQCAMQRAMRAQLDSLDRTWSREILTDRQSMARAARVCAERRNQVVDAFIRAGFVGCTMPFVIKVPMKVEQEQIEVARDAWQEDLGAVPPTERWRSMLKDVPPPVQNYIGKRFEAEREELARLVAKAEREGKDPPTRESCFRITTLTYTCNADMKYEVTDNTPGCNSNEDRWGSSVSRGDWDGL